MKGWTGEQMNEKPRDDESVFRYLMKVTGPKNHALLF